MDKKEARRKEMHLDRRKKWDKKARGTDTGGTDTGEQRENVKKSYIIYFFTVID